MSERTTLTQQDLEYAFHLGYEAGHAAGTREATLKASLETERFRSAKSEAELIVYKKQDKS